KRSPGVYHVERTNHRRAEPCRQRNAKGRQIDLLNRIAGPAGNVRQQRAQAAAILRSRSGALFLREQQAQIVPDTTVNGIQNGKWNLTRDRLIDITAAAKYTQRKTLHRRRSLRLFWLA